MQHHSVEWMCEFRIRMRRERFQSTVKLCAMINTHQKPSLYTIRGVFGSGFDCSDEVRLHTLVCDVFALSKNLLTLLCDASPLTTVFLSLSSAVFLCAR